MKKFIFILTSIILFSSVIVFLFTNFYHLDTISSLIPHQKQEVFKDQQTNLTSKVGKDKLQIYKDGKWEDFLIKGVNIGISKPRYFPGEAAITKEEYTRWFQYIGEMNANAVRVYTLHPPAFYQALYDYNKKAKNPIYLFHGVWIDQTNLVKYQDTYNKAVTDQFKQSIADTIDVIHGNIDIPKKPGHASGSYTADISPYVIGWIIGVEWDPHVVKNTNDKNKRIPQINDKYFSTKQASPFEIWLAQMMNYTTAYEMNKYQWQRPVSFINWVTTDLIKHPSEPYPDEDLVSVNPNHISITKDNKGGYFASYHIYPYYPDFLNYEPKYVQYIDKEGSKNSYAGYIHDLHSIHNMPILIAEFGVPSSRGMTHENIDGMNQGFISEKAQGEIDTKLFKNIVDEGLAGGLIFNWQDEWFKRTWNTMDYDDPNRRPFWYNAQTNEQHFGLLSFDPGMTQKISIDGQKKDWEKLQISPAYNKTNNAVIDNLYATSDDGYLYLRIDYKKTYLAIDKINTKILVDTIDDQGNKTIPDVNALTLNFGIDFLIDINNHSKSRVLVDSYYDTFYYKYTHEKLYLKPLDYPNTKNNGIFDPIQLTLTKGFTIPTLNKNVPFKSYETGKLLEGITDPKSSQYNSLADYYIDKQANVIELRIPWALLNIKDPSQRQIMGDIWKNGLTSHEITKGIRLGVIAYDNEHKKILATLPRTHNNMLQEKDFYLYTWQKWDKPEYHERLKKSYDIIKKAFSNY